MQKFERLARVERTGQALKHVAKLAGLDASHLWAGLCTAEDDARLIEVCDALEAGQLPVRTPKFMRHRVPPVAPASTVTA